MAESVGTVNGPVTVSADPSAWTQSQGLYAGNPRDPEVIETSALSNGVVFSIAAVEAYGLYPGNPIQFVGGGIDTNLNEDYSVIWTLSQPIYGFSGYFTTNVPPASQGADVGMGPSGAQVQTGFFGVSSSEPIGSLIYITDAGCPGTGSDQCNSIFNFTDLQFQFLPAPEPSYTPLLIALVVLALAKLLTSWSGRRDSDQSGQRHL